jgi:class 3 adenylate cyclase
MKPSKDILEEVRKIFKSEWDERNGLVVPDPEDIALDNDAVMLDGTVLYADLMDSTGLVQAYKRQFSAEIYKSYLKSSCYVIKNNGGEITAFDGDRVMAVFIGANKNSSAVKAALQINYIVDRINTEIKGCYPKSSYQISHTIGIDTSELYVARTGVRANNDLVWVGRSANYAAKICSNESFKGQVTITADVHKRLNSASKSSAGESMWTKSEWGNMNMTVYYSKYWWAF